MTIKGLKGFKDILPEEVSLWQMVERKAREIFHRYGFTEIKVPILEKTELFVRTIGEDTDIVEKEMYTFTDRNGASITMRPEGTAPVIRAYIEHGLNVKSPVQRLYTTGPMFRHERPQKGRLRQFHQLSVEVLGSNSPKVDAEVMAMAWQLLQEIGLLASLEINSLGCPECRPSFKEALSDFLASRQNNLCEDCQRRSKTNPLRVLDCKSDNCQKQYEAAPSILDYLCTPCEEHFQEVQQGLTLLDIPYTLNSFMVRGLDYYSRTTFELITGDLGAQSAIGAGGRYDGLVRQLGGPDVPGIGFAMGMERLIMLLSQQPDLDTGKDLDLFVIAMGDAAYEKCFVMVQKFRVLGIRVLMDHEGRSMKKQLKLADKHNARFALLLGDDELAKKEATIKNMVSGEQLGVPLIDDIEQFAKKIEMTLS